MIEERFENEEEIRRFLLGAMSADERAAFEARFIAEDSDLFDRIGVVEDELIESYVRETLSPAEKAKFEQSFLNSETRRARLAFTRTLFDKLSAESLATAAKKTDAAAEKPAVWNSFLNLFKTPRMAFGAALAILVLVFGLWFLAFKKSENGGEIVRQATPPPILAEMPQTGNQNAAPPAAVNVDQVVNNTETNKTPTATANAANSNTPPPKEPAPKSTRATLALFTAGTVRSEGKTGELNLTKDTTGANFVLNLESPDYKTYRAEIVDADGAVVSRSGRLTARKRSVSAYFPTARLRRGDYLIKLYGINAAGEEESAADFQFRVNRK